MPASSALPLLFSSGTSPLLAADASAQLHLPVMHFFGAFLGMVIGGLITARMPAFVIKKEPYVFIGLGAFFGFVLAEALIGMLFMLLMGCCLYALHRSWSDIEPVIQQACSQLRGEIPAAPSQRAMVYETSAADERQRREAEQKRREAAVYEQIVAEVEAQARRFHYPEELKQREIEHRFRKWRQQQCQV